MLSAKLAEGQIRIVDSEVVEKPKTKILNKMLEESFGDRMRVLLVSGYNTDKNFLIASQNLKQIQLTQPNVFSYKKNTKKKKIKIL
jgi:ribosomal protein L4